ncbi:hypothetical protein CLV51_105240 [Chitinophaga niastensis]|uniref:GLPGLI family protein n=1 Tax=Chitinophaga niastensis TaxID=536980 RepID=A0A2P8HF67_CHINA|nr:hypothetical protein [Chitinophaga niastensis]PSL44867.1 hypothetical protein CLV51_105240 [Chitinophaga niastensis]
MKLLILLLSFSSLTCLAQSFEGKITYANSCKSKLPNLKDEQLNSMMGTTQEYYIKGDNYKSTFNGSFIKSQIYSGAENRSYTLTAKSDTLYWEDYGQNKDVATTYEIEKGKETIMGVLCDVLIVSAPHSKAYYYYNGKYGIDPELFKRHLYGNWYYFISKTRSLPLKTVYENDQFILTSIAVNIAPAKLDDSLFKISDRNKTVPATW